MEKLNFKDVGRSCPIRCNDNCPSREDCLRYFAAQQTPDDLAMHLCVTPMVAKGERCWLFQKKETVQVAYGFERSLDVVLGKDLTAIRKALRAYFGYEGMVQYDRMDDVFMLEPVPY